MSTPTRYHNHPLTPAMYRRKDDPGTVIKDHNLCIKSSQRVNKFSESNLSRMIDSRRVQYPYLHATKTGYAQRPYEVGLNLRNYRWVIFRRFLSRGQSVKTMEILRPFNGCGCECWGAVYGRPNPPSQTWEHNNFGWSVCLSLHATSWRHGFSEEPENDRGMKKMEGLTEG